MAASGRINFGTMDEVVFGKPAAEAVAEQAQRLGATRVFLMVSSSLNRNTDEIDKVRRRSATAAPASSTACRRIRPARPCIAGDGTGAGRQGRPHRHYRRRLHHRRRQGRADVPCQRHPHRPRQSTRCARSRALTASSARRQ